MTISSTIRKAGPFVGNSVATAFDFEFKVFAKTDVQVLLTEIAVGGDETLVLDSDYSVALNADQDNNPGGVVTYPISGSAMAITHMLTILSAIEPTQEADLHNQGGYKPTVIENALDRVVALYQQALEILSRTLRFASSDTSIGSNILPVGRANKYLAFDANGDVALSSGTGADAGLREDLAETSGTVGASLVGYKQSGSNPAARTVLDKSREHVSIEDFGGGTDKGNSTNATAIMRAQTYLRLSGGGIIEVMCRGNNGRYGVQGSVVDLEPNVVIDMGFPGAPYSDVEFEDGPGLVFEDGDFGIYAGNYHSGIINGRIIRAAAGTTPYGLVCAGPMTVCERVGTFLFDYGITAGGGLNANTFDNIATIGDGTPKIGFSVLPANSGGGARPGLYAFPLIDSLIGATGNTTFDVVRLKTRGNGVGIAILSGNNINFLGGVNESNAGPGIIGFQRTGAANCSDILFDRMWFENNSDLGYDITAHDIKHLKTSPTEYLKGNVHGQWSSATDGNNDIWLGSAIEGTNARSDVPGGWKWRDCQHAPKYNLFHFRSAIKPTIENCTLGSINSATFIRAGHINPDMCNGLLIKNPKGTALSAQITEMKVPGANTTYVSEHGALHTVSYVLAATGAWKDIATVSAMSKNNRYRYACGPAGVNYATYAQEGTIRFDGTNYIFVKEVNLAGSEVQITAGVLQYRQNSGGALDVYGKVNCDGLAGNTNG